MTPLTFEWYQLNVMKRVKLLHCAAPSGECPQPPGGNMIATDTKTMGHNCEVSGSNMTHFLAEDKEYIPVSIHRKRIFHLVMKVAATIQRPIQIFEKINSVE